MTRPTRTTTAVSAVIVLLVAVPLASRGEPGPGSDRHATNIAMARATHGDRADGRRADAAVLPGVTREALRDLLAPDATVHVLGGPAAVSDDVVEVSGRVSAADGRTRGVRQPVTVVGPPAHGTSPEGFRVAAGTGPVVGTVGPLVRWTAEVELATGRPLDQLLSVVAATLGDPDRGWTARGELRLQRVDDPVAADVRVVLATPDTVDAFCARHGLDTAGTYSCWDGQRAMLNLTRWDHGTADFDDLVTYRTYQVNHEVGHGLGRGHVDCSAAGMPAPIMMQQTKSVGACRPNGWPHP